MSLPTVSVIVSSYNRPQLLPNALQSIAHQSYEGPIEVIVADDYSTDPGVEAVLFHYAEFFEGTRIALKTVRPDKPPMNALERIYGGRCAQGVNAGLEVATGDYAAFLPDDDYLTPGSLQKRVEFLEAHPDATVCFGRLEACKPADGKPWPWGNLFDHWHANWPSPTMSYGVYEGEHLRTCTHDREGFFAAGPIARAANCIDHGMVMVRRQGTILPDWPVHRTCEIARSGWAREHVWTELVPKDWHVTEEFDCPDAGWFYRLERKGLGPFYPVDAVVIVKRYHAHGHRTDPARRE